MARPKQWWRRIADSRVRHVWKLACRCATVGGTMVGDDVAVVAATRQVPPTFYDEHVGVPEGYGYQLLKRAQAMGLLDALGIE